MQANNTQAPKAFATWQKAAAKTYLQNLQNQIVIWVETADGKPAVRESWEKGAEEKLQGNGLTIILEDGALFERAGCGFSHVRGAALPSAASQRRPELAGCPFEAMGVSVVLHPQNPYVPTVHMNVRMLCVHSKEQVPVIWFGGGMDLTPYYGFVEDAMHFHRVCKACLSPLDANLYPRFKTWCDEYFYLPHRGEARGIGGIFFDDFAEFGWDQDLAVWQAVGNAFLAAYRPIVEKRQAIAFGQRERDFQLYRRGRYVEFNLVFDRGTHFGLQSGGRAESILLSMPRQAHWAYQYQPQEGSPESKLYTDFLPVRDWV